MLENLFGRPKNKSSGSRNSQGPATSTPSSSSAQMTGPFVISAPQMPQPPNLPYPAAPYPGDPSASTTYYPSLPFSLPPQMPSGYKTMHTTSTSAVSPLDSVPFEAKLTLSNSTNLVSLDQLFKEIKKAAEVVDRADAYLRSSQSDYDFKTEQTLIFQ